MIREIYRRGLTGTGWVLVLAVGGFLAFGRAWLAAATRGRTISSRLFWLGLAGLAKIPHFSSLHLVCYSYYAGVGVGGRKLQVVVGHLELVMSFFQLYFFPSFLHISRLSRLFPLPAVFYLFRRLFPAFFRPFPVLFLLSSSSLPFSLLPFFFLSPSALLSFFPSGNSVESNRTSPPSSSTPPPTTPSHPNPHTTCISLTICSLDRRIDRLQHEWNVNGRVDGPHALHCTALHGMEWNSMRKGEVHMYLPGHRPPARPSTPDTLPPEAMVVPCICRARYSTWRTGEAGAAALLLCSNRQPVPRRWNRPAGLAQMPCPALSRPPCPARPVPPCCCWRCLSSSFARSVHTLCSLYAGTGVDGESMGRRRDWRRGAVPINSASRTDASGGTCPSIRLESIRSIDYLVVLGCKGISGHILLVRYGKCVPP